MIFRKNLKNCEPHLVLLTLAQLTEKLAIFLDELDTIDDNRLPQLLYGYLGLALPATALKLEEFNQSQLNRVFGLKFCAKRKTLMSGES